ncbi:MAG: sel1 repeat family protein [Lachnospiraceae bacterium]|nr:sel1 repeat family protein [Lachnospiraceae bacterium]
MNNRLYFLGNCIEIKNAAPWQYRIMEKVNMISLKYSEEFENRIVNYRLSDYCEYGIQQFQKCIEMFSDELLIIMADEFQMYDYNRTDIENWVSLNGHFKQVQQKIEDIQRNIKIYGNNLNKKIDYDFTPKYHFVGGGFGVKGAIKGIFTADVANWTMNKVSNRIKRREKRRLDEYLSSIKAGALTEELKSELQKGMYEDMFSCVYRIFEGAESKDDLLSFYYDNEKKDAEKIYSAFKSGRVSSDNKKNTLTELIETYPLELKYYYLAMLYFPKDIEEIINFASSVCTPDCEIMADEFQKEIEKSLDYFLMFFKNEDDVKIAFLNEITNNYKDFLKSLAEKKFLFSNMKNVYSSLLIDEFDGIMTIEYRYNGLREICIDNTSIRLGKTYIPISEIVSINRVRSSGLEIKGEKSIISVDLQPDTIDQTIILLKMVVGYLLLSNLFTNETKIINVLINCSGLDLKNKDAIKKLISTEYSLEHYSSDKVKKIRLAGRIDCLKKALCDQIQPCTISNVDNKNEKFTEIRKLFSNEKTQDILLFDYCNYDGCKSGYLLFYNELVVYNGNKILRIPNSEISNVDSDENEIYVIRNDMRISIFKNCKIDFDETDYIEIIAFALIGLGAPFLKYQKSNDVEWDTRYLVSQGEYKSNCECKTMDLIAELEVMKIPQYIDVLPNTGGNNLAIEYRKQIRIPERETIILSKIVISKNQYTGFALTNEAFYYSYNNGNNRISITDIVGVDYKEETKIFSKIGKLCIYSRRETNPTVGGGFVYKKIEVANEKAMLKEDVRQNYLDIIRYGLLALGADLSKEAGDGYWESNRWQGEFLSIKGKYVEFYQQKEKQSFENTITTYTVNTDDTEKNRTSSEQVNATQIIKAAVQSIYKGDFQEGIAILNEYVGQNNNEAQYELANIYEYGPSGIQDLNKAFYLYDLSAKQGNSFSMCALADCYFNGHGCTTDKKLAIEWYEKAIKQDNEIAFYKMAEMYSKGEYVAKDIIKALDLYEHAIKKNYTPAMLGTAQIYLAGEVVGINKEYAKKLIEMAASNGNTKGYELLNSIN